MNRKELLNRLKKEIKLKTQEYLLYLYDIRDNVINDENIELQGKIEGVEEIERRIQSIIAKTIEELEAEDE